jgi:N-acetylglucosaminyl-diphospho-decaprenol L-rhamnosyltransferase
MPDLAVVIISWNTRELTLNALRSLYADLASSGLSADVYVVDNASTDGSAIAIADEFPKVKLIISKDNLGFGGGNNLAITQIISAPQKPNAVYLLNSDTITHPGATRALYDYLLSAPRIGLVGAGLTYADGRYQHSAFDFPGLRQLWVEFFPTPGRMIEGRFNGRHPQHEQPFPVDFVLGATMMLRPEVIEQTGMFDERYFMYCEEIDWAWRIHDANWEVWCVPTAHITHLAGQSTAQVRPRSVIDLWTSRLLLAQKHYPRWKLLLARWLIAFGMGRKMRRTQTPALREAYRQVQNMALRR